MSPALHHDQGLRAARELVTAFVAKHRQSIPRAVLLDDLFGRIRLLLEITKKTRALQAALGVISGALGREIDPYWAGEDPWLFDLSDEEQDRSLFEVAWAQGVAIDDDRRIRLTTRVRDHSGWFAAPGAPPWPTADAQAPRSRKKGVGPPIVAFLSFKGGVGRTTSLAAFALQRARLGETVVVVDLDLDAPGVGTLFDDDPPLTRATHGVVDFLLEAPLLGDRAEIEEYSHRCRRARVVGDGPAIVVVPAGRVGADYLSGLARVDLELPSGASSHPLVDLLHALRKLRPSPDWILLDGRAGLSEVAGVLTSGIAHLHVLFATSSEQSYAGLAQFVRRLGAERLLASEEPSQADLLIVQTMVPARHTEESTAEFRDRVAEIFRASYFTEGGDPDNRLWSVDDIDNAEGPHQPLVIHYQDHYAFFKRIDEIADRLVEDSDYRGLGGRILGRFPGFRERS